MTVDLSRLGKLRDRERTWGLKVPGGTDVDDLVVRLRAVVGEGVLVNTTARPAVIGISLLSGCDVEATIGLVSSFEEIVGVVPYPQRPTSPVDELGGCCVSEYLVKDMSAWQEWALEWICKYEIRDRYNVTANCNDMGDGIERLHFVVSHADLCWLLRSRRYWSAYIESDHGQYLDSIWGPSANVDEWRMSGNVFMAELLPGARAEMLALFEAADARRSSAIIEFGVGGATLTASITTADTDAITKVSHHLVNGEARVLGDIPEGISGLRVERDGEWVRLQFGEESDGPFPAGRLREQIFAARRAQREEGL